MSPERGDNTLFNYLTQYHLQGLQVAPKKRSIREIRPGRSRGSCAPCWTMLPHVGEEEEGAGCRCCAGGPSQRGAPRRPAGPVLPEDTKPWSFWRARGWWAENPRWSCAAAAGGWSELTSPTAALAPWRYLFCRFNALCFIVSPYVRFSARHSLSYGQFTDVAADRGGLLAVGTVTTSEET